MYSKMAASIRGCSKYHGNVTAAARGPKLIRVFRLMGLLASIIYKIRNYLSMLTHFPTLSPNAIADTFADVFADLR